MSDFEIPALHLPEFIEAQHVESGPPYEDEPSEIVPAGWWVLGHDGADTEFEIHLGKVEDAYGNDISEQVAKLFAAALEEASAKGAELPDSEQTPATPDGPGFACVACAGSDLPHTCSRYRAPSSVQGGTTPDDLAEQFPELANARIRFWVCPVHRELTDDHGRQIATVEWRGDIAHCTTGDCQITSATSAPSEGDTTSGELTQHLRTENHDAQTAKEASDRHVSPSPVRAQGDPQ